ncbi:MAG TPA: hypothetical protein VK694_02950 [Verrucomicrobiae bacterium]|nr:hypothetical protein [Verrucomicrobiae bacterium]
MSTSSAQSRKVDRLLKVADLETDLGLSNDHTLFAIADATGDDLSGNANLFVPWSDAMIPFECSCGAIIYSDSPHTHDG